MAEKGLILVDTKYEFGLDGDGMIVVADEIHTPDSSRFWIGDRSMSAKSRTVWTRNSCGCGS